ncbi:aminotransferase class I/II-fold pyridoxal phosphate-dependent enzyme [Alphaproteobacteria bacterium GH1-50]|uniref:Aminotransferase class I/II-fold pyridoxal phosphate-dependent enzyme n=1 Tax=Kangsaoukella pontilimi TaxID=2691042 RepID=A0A7C9IN71_9RHOB|nr:aminotransferase class I/II-fold pyridoxal phosphate-dependent enzyme [Kangsaoukella pontilimi]MXQ07170.1 aminotransferase class I/II-fold pyridoxal phosphate-dependent enzyme [Kangsaoukella pontilimi]
MTDRPRGTRRALFPSSVSRPVVSPLQPSVVYASPDPDTLDAQYEGGAKGYTYAREAHPNAELLEGLLNGAEGAGGGVVTGSGMAAVTAALLATVRAGDHLLGADQLYGRSLRLMAEDLPRFGIATSLADPTDVAAIEAALRPETRMILIETTSNPTLRVADVDGIVALAKARGILVAVDNTFATPRGLRPLERGADIVIHSVTKLLAGHSDATLGYVGANDPALVERMRVLSQTMGLTASPFDCWLAERGLYSFDMRYDRATANAARLAEALAGMEGVTRVIYPARQDHPDHARTATLLSGEGGHMVSFEVAPTRAAANALVRAAEGIAFAPTLGDIATTLSHPATSSHRALTPEGRAALGISEGFFRVSVGCEDADDLIRRFAQAVAAANGV